MHCVKQPRYPDDGSGGRNEMRLADDPDGRGVGGCRSRAREWRRVSGGQ